MWTRFWDMHSGGGQKEKQSMIYIEAPEKEAKIIFYNRFGHNPERVTCTCCGDDYSIESDESLARLTGFHRGCANLETPRGKNGRYKEPKDPWFHDHYYLEFGEEAEATARGYEFAQPALHEPYQTLEQYVSRDDVLVIKADEIKPSEREGDLPEQGYVWMG